MNTKLKLEKQFKKLSSSTEFVLAISGGRDSIVLLDLAKKLIPGRFIVAHFNHGLRELSGTTNNFFNIGLAIIRL